MKKLSGRPFLIVEFIERPRESVNTKKSGWQNDRANIATFEQVSVVDRISNKHNTTPIIIDLVEGVAVHNATNKPDDELIAHYIDKYEATIMSALKLWAGKEIENQITTGRENLDD